MENTFKYGDAVTILYDADLHLEATVISYQTKGIYMLKSEMGIVFYHEKWLKQSSNEWSIREKQK